MADRRIVPAAYKADWGKDMRERRARSIRVRLTVALAAALVCIALLAAAASVLLVRMADSAASIEAEDVARAMTASLEISEPDPSQMQGYLVSLGSIYKRDIFVVDPSGKIVADSNPARIGKRYVHDAVAQSLSDGKARTFVGPDSSGSGAEKQVAVAMHGGLLDLGEAATGVMVFEYSALYRTLLSQAYDAAMLAASMATGLVIAFWLLGRKTVASIVHPLRALRKAAFALADGDYSARVLIRRHDEVGELGEAFNAMAAEIQSGRQELSARAAELASVNRRLQLEIEKRKDAAERIEHLAYHDELTSLPNRSMFTKLLGQQIKQSLRYKKHFALLFFDLDRFKQINDTLGHDTGDALLETIANRLHGCLRATDTVARLGGDEFVVLLPDLEQRSDGCRAQAVAQNLLACVSQPIVLAGQDLRTTASIGIATFPAHGTDEKTLMKSADVAMYRAKAAGKNTFRFYSADMNADSFEKLSLESSLRRAVEGNELELHYQAKRNFRTGAVSGMEALVRWNHPDLGLVSPLQFIPIAEETGLIVPIGQWVLRTACEQLMAWRRTGIYDLVVAVNLSPRQFADDRLLDDITSILSETGIPATLLELEITESMIMQNADKARTTLIALKQMGCSIAIDDFGTGYSSLSNLKQFPISTLKIDRSFIRDLATDPEDRGITEAIIAMGKTLQLHLVAEGVETREQAEFLRERGCDDMQGYYFSKPLPADQFAHLIRAQAMVKAMVGGPSTFQRLLPVE